MCEGKRQRRIQTWGKHTGSGKSGASACYASYTPVEDYDDDDDTIEPADAYQAHNDPVNPRSDDGGEALDDDDDDENDTFSSYVALDDVTVVGSAELDATTSQRTSLHFLRTGERKR